MTTNEICYEDCGMSGFGKFMVFLTLTALVIGGMIFIESFVNGRSHADERHGEDLDVSKCRDMFSTRGGYLSLWKNSESKHCAQLGEVEKGDGGDMMERGKEWIIRIVDSVTGEEITIFSTCGTLRCVENALMNGGYAPLR